MKGKFVRFHHFGNKAHNITLFFKGVYIRFVAFPKKGDKRCPYFRSGYSIIVSYSHLNYLELNFCEWYFLNQVLCSRDLRNNQS